MRNDRFLRHPLRVAAATAARLRAVVDDGESAETYAVVIAVVAVFVLSLAAVLISLDLAIWELA